MWLRSCCSGTWFLHTRSTTNRAISRVGRTKAGNRRNVPSSLDNNSSSRSVLSSRSNNNRSVSSNPSDNSSHRNAHSNSNHNVLSKLGKSHTVLNNHRSARGSRRNPGSSSGDGYSVAAGRGTITGNKIAPGSGRTSIVPGRSAAGTVVITFLSRPSVCISAGNISSASAAAPRCIWGIRASFTAAFHSC